MRVRAKSIRGPEWPGARESRAQAGAARATTRETRETPPAADWIASAELGYVTEALHAYERTTGRAPLMLGGWDVEDPTITPPPDLLHRLRAIQPQLQSYAYGKDFHRARGLAAEVYGQTIRFAQRHDGTTDGTSPRAAPLSPDQVAIAPNSSQGLLLALTAFREQGVRRAVIAGPCYFAVIRLCRHLGLEISFVPAGDFLTGALDIPRIRRALAGAPAAVLIVTNPAYSVGVEYSPAQLRALFAAVPANTYILLDEARLGLSWTHDGPWRPAAYVGDGLYPPQTIILRSPSKIFFLNGAKTAFLFGPAPLMRAVERISETLVGSMAGAAEEVALAYLATLAAWADEATHRRVGPLGAWQAGVIAALRGNLQRAAATLTPLGVALAPVDSGPYALAVVSRAHQLARRLTEQGSLRAAREQGVLLLTANHFYHHAADQVGFRLNLCGDPARTGEALARVCGGA